MGPGRDTSTTCREAGAAAFLWCLPAGAGRALPYFYFFPFLTLLLLDRAFRDDARCAAKYGAAWRLVLPGRALPRDPLRVLSVLGGWQGNGRAAWR